MDAPLFEGKGAVIEPTAHADAIALCIEGDEGHEYHIERPGHDDFSVLQERLGYAEAVFDHCGSLFERGEPQAIAGTSPEYGQVGQFAGLQRQLEQGGGIDFAAGSKVERYPVAVSEGFVVAGEVQQAKAVPFERLPAQSPALVAHLTA